MKCRRREREVREKRKYVKNKPFRGINEDTATAVLVRIRTSSPIALVETSTNNRDSRYLHLHHRAEQGRVPWIDSKTVVPIDSGVGYLR
jgi:hypothetical protein